ncbi:Fc.00g004960.m01.CDS01 [Cosmosporella sp. VM-42]
MAAIDEKQRMARQDSDLLQAAPQYSPRDDVSEALVTDGFQLPSIDTETEQPPPYGENPDQVQFSQPGFETSAAVTGDGRVNININTKNRRLADLLAPTLQSQIVPDTDVSILPPAYIPPSLGGQPGQTPPPRLNVVIQIVGSRGDVQPFVALGKVLKDTYGHRVRIATHPTFQTFVEENDLEFFNIGGDPAELMAFMVKHPGLMPGFDAITSGEVSKRRKGIQEILMGCWRSCIEAGTGLGPPPKPHAKGDPLDHTMQLPGDPNSDPFVADAIIANPPSFAHIHIAEKLGIPLHMMFTMPWSPTRMFPHPLANIQSSNADDVLTSYMSYTLVEMMTWQGLGDVINRFREKALDLPPLSMIWAPGLLARLKIPWTYCWSPALIPKPNDWGRGIDIAGFYFLNLASSYTPDPELAAFLAAGPPPVYIGFGSIVVDDPNAMTRMIFDAVHLAGVRALVSKGWGGLGAEDVGLPEGVFMLGNCPHDWLFQHVSCVVHHGGAGTTAAGIKAGKPTVVVPFFGDQPFWGAMVARAGAGPDPIPYKELTADKLAEALKFCLEPNTLQRATELGHKIREEQGTDVGGKSFHDHLDVDNMRCSVAPSRTAVWRVRRTQIRLSPLAAAVLVDEGLIKYGDLKLYRAREYITEDQPIDPISGCASSLVGDIGSIGMAIADMPREIFRGRQRIKKHSISGPQSGEGSDKPTVQGSDTASTMPPFAELDSLHPEPSHDTLGSTLTSQSHANLSQPSISEISSMSSPGPSASQMPASPRSPETQRQTPAERESSPVGGVGLNAALGTGRGVGRIVTTGVKSPMNFCLGAAKGFRNIPRLYNDDTVRPVEKVTDFSTGIKVAGKELGYGLFDGIAGLVTQPYRGAEKEGVQGLIKGFGKGIGGFFVKPAAGMWGVPAYAMQGVHAEINKFFTKSVQNYIITSRAVQGERDMQKSGPEERADILQRWNNIKFDLKNFYQLKRKEKTAGKLPVTSDNQSATQGESGFERPRTGWLYTKKMSFDERKRLHAQREQWKKGYVETNITPPSTSGGSSIQTTTSEDAEFEKAIQASVRETSRGNAEEDAAVEAAIRESVRAVRQKGGLSELIPELPEKTPAIFGDEEYQITDEEYQALIEQAIKHSLGTDPPLPQDSGFVELEAMDTTVFSEPAGQTTPLPPANEDAELQRAIEESKNASHLPPRNNNEDEELQRALAASKEAMDKEASQRTEEEIVLEYVKKQSLAEEEYRRKMANDKVPDGEGVDEEEELRKAMEESLRLSRGDDSGPSRM